MCPGVQPPFARRRRLSDQRAHRIGGAQEWAQVGRVRPRDVRLRGDRSEFGRWARSHGDEHVCVASYRSAERMTAQANGSTTHATGSWKLQRVDAARMKILALLLADPNPVHLDPAAARRLGIADRE